jgi:hypothetical protein
MTVWIYVDTSKLVGDKDHLRVFATEDAAQRWFVSLSADNKRSLCRVPAPGSGRSANAYPDHHRAQRYTCRLHGRSR